MNVGPKWEEVTGAWRKLCYEELKDLIRLPGVIKVVRQDRMGSLQYTCAAYIREALNEIKILFEKCTRKRAFGRAWHRLKDSIETDVTEIECEDFRNLPWTINPLMPACVHYTIVPTYR